MSSFSSEFDFMRSSSGVQKAKKSKKYTHFLNVKGFAKTYGFSRSSTEQRKNINVVFETQVANERLRCVNDLFPAKTY